MDLIEIARWLNGQGISAAPCTWLSAISIFVDEDYENYDYDIIGPRARRGIARVLQAHGFRRLTGRAFAEPKAGRIEFPRPTRTLASDPVAELVTALDHQADAVFATPTQILLLTWRREGPELSSRRSADLVALVREQPANIDKVGNWLRRTALEPGFRQLEPTLRQAQDEGTELRRRGRFRSQLPR